jgi:hypothetical protein
VIDRRIEKPWIELAEGSLVATTDSLLRASGLAHDLLEKTGVRTPLGRVLIARLRNGGAIEVAGPSAAADVRAVSDAMLGHGAEQVLVDGAVDRRAASSPDVADGLVLATGAVLSENIDEVVAKTKDAVDLVRLPQAPETTGPNTIVLPPYFALTCDETQIGALLDANPSATNLTTGGALPAQFLDALTRVARRGSRKLTVVAEDPTKVFLTDRGPSWYTGHNIDIHVARPIALAAITVNPVAPQSHRFDTMRLKALLRDAITGVPLFDVLEAAFPRP